MNKFKDLEFHVKDADFNAWVKISEDLSLGFSVRELKWPLNTGKWMIDIMKKDGDEWKPLGLDCLNGHDRLFEKDEEIRRQKIEEAKAEIQKLADALCCI